jgi:hypothetical protein
VADFKSIDVTPLPEGSPAGDADVEEAPAPEQEPASED